MEYMRKKIKVCHEHPTGKKCQRQAKPEEASSMDAVLEKATVTSDTDEAVEEASARSLQKDQRRKKKVHQRIIDLHILEESSNDDTGRSHHR